MTRTSSMSDVYVPHWNHLTRELRLGTALVKRFRRPAQLQELILDAFEEQKWVLCIDDPLPRDSQTNSKTRLHDTIKRLNHNLSETPLRFHGGGTGLSICWALHLSRPKGQKRKRPNKP